jgi:hypothetical protein
MLHAEDVGGPGQTPTNLWNLYVQKSQQKHASPKEKNERCVTKVLGGRQTFTQKQEKFLKTFLTNR